MKNFYYNIVETKTSKTTCGRKQTTNIYTVKKNQIIFLGTINWNTAGYRGEQSEVYQFLLKNKFVTAKQNNDPKGLNDYYNYNQKYFTINQL